MRCTVELGFTLRPMCLDDFAGIVSSIVLVYALGHFDDHQLPRSRLLACIFMHVHVWARMCPHTCIQQLVYECATLVFTAATAASTTTTTLLTMSHQHLVLLLLLPLPLTCFWCILHCHLCCTLFGVLSPCSLACANHFQSRCVSLCNHLMLEP